MRQAEATIHVNLVVAEIQLLKQSGLYEHASKEYNGRLEALIRLAWQALLPQEVVADLQVVQLAMLADRVEDRVTVRPAQHVVIQKQIAQLGRLLEVGAESGS